MINLPGLFLPTGVGSLPHVDPDAAVQHIMDKFREVPYWPQLPRRTFLENMYIQYAASLPASDIEGEKLLVEGGEAMMEQAEGFYQRFLSGDLGSFAIPDDRAKGLTNFLDRDCVSCLAVKGQITGPVSFGLLITDRNKKPLFYDPVGRDVLIKHLLRVAQWQVEQLQRMSPNVIIIIDEPYLASVGSAVISLSPEEVITSLNEVLDGLPGTLSGVHCCANTDWGLVLSTNVNYLSFDAYEYSETVLLYPEKVQLFLDRGGKLAFGMVPTSSDAIKGETPETLGDRMEKLFGAFEERGIPREQLIASAFITPACGLGMLSEELAERANQLVVELSALLRHRYGE